MLLDTQGVRFPSGGFEGELVQQLFQDEDDIYGKLIDQFYFEEHVKQEELRRSWGWRTKGSVLHSLQLFSGLRKKGIPTHHWV